jgi:DNA-directed RNA polymerase specialized sigma24 family protein
MLHNPLSRLLEREIFAEIIRLLTPKELLIAALRLEGLTDTEIGALLGVGRTTVSQQMRKAQARIAAELPEAASLLADRRAKRSRTRGAGPPLQRGWLCQGKVRPQK